MATDQQNKRGCVQEMAFENAGMAKEFLEDFVDGGVIPSFIRFVDARVVACTAEATRFAVGRHTLECAAKMIVSAGAGRRAVHVYVEHGAMAWPDGVSVQTEASRELAPMVLEAVESAQSAKRLARQVASAKRGDFTQELEEAL
jgi:hypothetical protein